MPDHRYSSVSPNEQADSSNGQDFSQGTTTRKICIKGLVASWLCGVGCLAGGAATFNIPYGDAYISIRFPSRIYKELAPLFINVVVTVLTECLGLIHSTTLRWTLGNRLTFNSNLRIFNACPGKIGLGRLSNLIQAFLLILSYCASGLIFAGYPPTAVCTDATALDVSTNEFTKTVCSNGGSAGFFPVSLIALGIGLTGQALLATIQIINYKPPTWSSSPFDTAWASTAKGTRTHHPHRSMQGVHESKLKARALTPSSCQPPAWSAHGEVRRVLIYLWILVVLAVSCFVAVYIVVDLKWKQCKSNGGDCDVYAGSSWSLLPDTAGATSLVNFDAVSEERYSFQSKSLAAAAFLVNGFWIIMSQSAITMALHCAELLVNMSRDEDMWRQAYGKGGIKPTNAFVSAAKSWKTVLLFVLKPSIHWLFGLGMAYYIGFGDFARPPQILYLSMGLTVLASFGTYLCFRKPRGPQPTTFGHVQTIVDLVDEWHPHLFWGHKGVRASGTCYAGTGRVSLERIRMNSRYA